MTHWQTFLMPSRQQFSPVYPSEQVLRECIVGIHRQKRKTGNKEKKRKLELIIEELEYLKEQL